MRASTESFTIHPLDRRFVGAKPIESAPIEVLADLEARGRLIPTRKRNGNAMFATVTGDRESPIGLYSRSIHTLTAHFPNLVEELRSLDIPAGTLLGAESLIQDERGIDSPDLFGRYARAKPENAVALQAQGAPIQLSLFNVIMHKGQIVTHLPYENRLDILRELLARRSCPNIDVVEVLDMSLAEAQARSIRSKWEGLVLYDADAPSAYRLDGRSDLVPRPDGCWKWKDYLEGDFIATGWRPSDAPSRKGMVKDLLIAQYDPVTKELVHWGKAGVGLSMAECREYVDDKLYPMVFEIVFERRTPNQRLIHARIKRRRHDKAPEECIAPIEFSVAKK